MADVLVENFVLTENFKRDREFMLKHLEPKRKDGDCEHWKIFQREYLFVLNLTKSNKYAVVVTLSLWQS